LTFGQYDEYGPRVDKLQMILVSGLTQHQTAGAKPLVGLELHACTRSISGLALNLDAQGPIVDSRPITPMRAVDQVTNTFAVQNGASLVRAMGCLPPRRNA